MDIVQAIKKAGSEYAIYRKNSFPEVLIVPTDTGKCCEMYFKGKLLSVRWNPKKSDLLASDWELAKR